MCRLSLGIFIELLKNYCQVCRPCSMTQEILKNSLRDLAPGAPWPKKNKSERIILKSTFFGIILTKLFKIAPALLSWFINALMTTLSQFGNSFSKKKFLRKTQNLLTRHFWRDTLICRWKFARVWPSAPIMRICEDLSAQIMRICDDLTAQTEDDYHLEITRINIRKIVGQLTILNRV